VSESSAPHPDEWWETRWQEQLCVPTYARRDAFGYGRHETTRYGRRLWNTHVIAWVDFHRMLPPPAKPMVLHRCIDHPWCIEPTHLYAGTGRDNARDRLRQGHVPQGEAHPDARLTQAQVDEIRERYSAGGVYQRELAAEFGVCRQHIGGIVRNVYWNFRTE
jgi:hypothetical protein